jgi:hypothetical protein
MTGKRDPLDLHPASILGATAAGRPEKAQSKRDAEADPVEDRGSVQRRLAAVLNQRLSPSRAARARTERAH